MDFSIFHHFFIIFQMLGFPIVILRICLGFGQYRKAILEFLNKITGLGGEEVLRWIRNRFKTRRSGSCASRNHHTLAQLPLDLEIS